MFLLESKETYFKHQPPYRKGQDKVRYEQMRLAGRSMIDSG